MIFELLQVPHIARYLVNTFITTYTNLFGIHSIVGEMAEGIIYSLCIIVLSGESHIAVWIIVHFERIPRGYNDPNSDIKLPI